MMSTFPLLRPALAVAIAAMALSATAAAETPAGFVLHESPRALPEIEFRNLHARSLSLADFRGKVVLLNIWATWCKPCRREMPTLDNLQAELGGSDFEVVALSVDRRGWSVVREFYEELGLWQLGVYADPSGTVRGTLNVLGIPFTFLIDRQGREIGRLIGPAEWDGDEMVAFLRKHLRQRAEPPVKAAAAES